MQIRLKSKQIIFLYSPIVEEGVEEALTLAWRDERMRFPRTRDLSGRSWLRHCYAETAQGKRVARWRLLLVHELLHGLQQLVKSAHGERNGNVFLVSR